jgi:membrane fusion protein (multidrug efflux system)
VAERFLANAKELPEPPMAYPFSRTLCALALDRSTGPRWLVAAVLLVLIGWFIWFLTAPITLYEVTLNARLEVDRAARPIATTVAGRVVSTSLALEQSVVAGQILVELDAEAEQRRLEQEQQHLSALRPELEALHRQLGEEEQILTSDAESARHELNIPRVRRSEAESAVDFAAEEVRRLTKVGDSSELELLHAKAEETKRRYNQVVLTLEIARLESDILRRRAENRARCEKLHRDADDLEGQINSTVCLLKVLETEIERHKVRAPANGRVGDVVTLPIGAVLNAGERLGVVVPESELKIVADFPPAALGRVREGRAARLRLEGFSWVQYGSLDARVAKVGSEVRDGRVRVELAVLSMRSPVPLQHGLPGTLEVELERVAPAILALRAAGGLWGRPAEHKANEVLP